MLETSKLTPLLLLGALLLATGACTPTPSAPEAQADGAAKPEPAEPEVPEAERVPKIACDEATFDFGGVTPTGSVEHVFKIKNVGNADLEIAEVKRT